MEISYVEMDAIAYKNVLCDNLPRKDVRVVSIQGKGNALLAARQVTKGQFVFGEEPLGSQQYGRNKALVRACEHCHRFIGTLENQFERLARVTSSTVQVSKLPKWEAKTIEKDFKKAFPSLKDFKCPMIDDSLLAPIVPCQWGCDVEYCSEHCRDVAGRRYHALMCTGRPPAAAASAAGGSAAGGSSDMDTEDHSGHDHDHDHDHEGGHSDEDDDEEDEDEDEEVDDGEEDDGHDDHDAVQDDDEVNAAALFEHQALSTNEVFLLAGRLVGRVLEHWVRAGNNMVEAMRCVTTLHSAPWDSLFEIRDGADRAKAKLLEEEAGEDEDEDIDDDEDEEEEDPETAVAALKAQVNEWLRDSLTILRALVKQRLPAIVAACGRAGQSRTSLDDWELDMVLAPETYSRLLGAFELNQIELKIDSPVRDYLRSLGQAAANGNTQAREAVAALGPVLAQIDRAYHARKQLNLMVAAATGEEDDAENEEADAEAADEDEDSDGPLLSAPIPAGSGRGVETLLVFPSRFPVCDGGALYALICTMNHSCDPNVQVMHPSGSHVGALVAQRDIAPGEELCINYIDAEQSKEARRLDLLHYGFTCACPRCQAEGEEEGESAA